MSINIKLLTPAIAIHPGTILKDELDARKIKQKDFALKTGIQPTQLNEIIKGKRRISAEYALLIGGELQMEPSIWQNMQSNYEMDLAKISLKTQERMKVLDMWRMIKAYIPEKFFKKLGYISGDPILDIPIINRIYGISNVDQLVNLVYTQNNLCVKFRKSTALSTDTIGLIGWSKLIAYEASKVKANPFDAKKKQQLLTSLKAAIEKNKNTVEETKKILHQFGVKFIAIPRPEKCAVEGISLWNNGNPVIGMTLRLSRIDNFAFTLFHELGHVFSHLVNNNTAEFIDTEKKENCYKNNKEEEEANLFATENLIPKASWNQFFTDPRCTQKETILTFAKQQKTHPAIIKWRLRYELNNYTLGFGIDDKLN